MRIGLSVGHGQKWEDGSVVDDPGAVHHEIGVTEFATCLRIANILEALLEEKRGVFLVRIPRNIPLRERISILNDSHLGSRIDVAIELHCNGYIDKGVDGTECLYYPGSVAGRLYAEKLQNSLVEGLRLNDRGAKAFDNEKRNAFLRTTAMPAVIVEPFFITNDDSAEHVISGSLVHWTAWSLFRGLTV